MGLCLPGIDRMDKAFHVSFRSILKITLRPMPLVCCAAAETKAQRKMTPSH